MTDLCARGVGRDQLILDPGFGFAKLAEHNWSLLAHLDAVQSLGLPVLVGASRKTFLGRLGVPEGGERPPSCPTRCGNRRDHGHRRTRGSLGGARPRRGLECRRPSRGRRNGGSSMTDRIVLQGISARGFHGVLDFEKADGQEFRRRCGLLRLTCDAPVAATSSRTRSTTPRWPPTSWVLITGPSLDLIETLADQIAVAALQRPLVQACRGHGAQAAGPGGSAVRRRPGVGRAPS